MGNMLGKALVSAMAGVAMWGATGVQAQTSVFESPAGSNATASSDDSVSLKLAPPKRFFARLGFTYIKPNTKSGEAYDAGDPVIARGELLRRALSGSSNVTLSDAFVVGTGLDQGMQLDGINGIGIPSGIKSDAKGAGAVTLALGSFLDEDQKWAAEGYVFALPFQNTVNGKGSIQQLQSLGGTATVETPNYLDGKEIIKTKQVPPTFMINRYFGDKNAKLRAAVGLGVSYAVFFDTQATSTLEYFAGGPTKVKIDNAFGYGPFLSLQYQLSEGWHIFSQLGYVKLKTQATLTTTNTRFDATSPAVAGYSGNVGYINRGILQTSASQVTAMLNHLAQDRGGDLGTFVRKQDVTLDPWVFNVSIGYSF